MPDRTKAKPDQARSEVFISYARSDGKAFAAGLRSRLEDKGFSLWQDVIAMEGGRDWWLQITDALDHVEFMALVITANALKSDTVRKEWRYARQQGVCVYPIKGSPDLDFGSMPRWMREKHFYDLDEPRQLEKFLNDLNTRCEAPRVPFMAEPLPLDFVPRPGEFNQLLSLLLDRESGDPVAITAALRGAGGYGKTTLAKALCHDEEVQNAFDGGILWVTLGESPGDLTRRVIDLIEVLTGERPGFSDVNAATARLRELLADRNAMLVIDDVWDSVHLTPFTQGSGRGARLITTRIIDVLPPNAKRVDVDAMRRDEAVALLGSGLPPQCETELRELATRLGEWPLLLELANRALRHRVEDLHQAFPKALEWVNKSLDKRGLTTFDARDPQAREQAVSKCLGVSLELLNTNERERYGEMAVFPEDIDVPLATLAKLWGRTGGLDDFDTEALCERLDRLSLLQRFDPNAHVIRLHDVVRGYLIGEQGEGLTAIHNALLESHRPSTDDRAPDAGAREWARLSIEEPYLWDHLAHHLIGAGQAAELIETVKDLRYAAAKTLARKALAVEADLLAAEKLAPSDKTLHALRRSFVQSGHVIDRCENSNDAEATLHSRLHGVAEVAPLAASLERGLRRPFVEPWHPLPDLPDPALVRTITGHNERVNGCAINGDGSIIVSASKDNSLKVWDARSGAELRTLIGHTAAVHGCAISADGSTIVSASADNTLKVWNTVTGNAIHTLSGHTGAISRCAITSNASLIVSASADGTLKIWDTSSGAELQTLRGHTSTVKSCAITSDGLLIVSASIDGTVKLWESATGTCLWTLGGSNEHKGAAVNCCDINADGSLVVSASDDFTLRTWDTKIGAERLTFLGHTDVVVDCCMSADSSFIVSASFDRTVKIWNTRAGTERLTLYGHSDWVGGCAVSRDGSFVVSASDDNTLRIWDVRDGRERRTLRGHTNSVAACAISPDGSSIVSASYDQTLRVWNADSGTERLKLIGHRGPVTCCTFSPDGTFIISGSKDGTLKVWETQRGIERLTLRGHSAPVNRCAINADGSFIVSASDDHTLKIWDPVTGSAYLTLSGHVAAVKGCAISRDGSLVVSASWDKSLKVWDRKTGVSRLTIGTASRISAPVRDCAINQDGSVIVFTSTDGSLNVVDGDGAPRLKFVSYPQWGNCCAFSPDGSFVVAGLINGYLMIWDTATGTEQKVLSGHSDWVAGCAISGNGDLMVSASKDRTVKLWEPKSAAHRSTTRGHTDWVADCAISPDGILVSASRDGTVKVWDADTGTERQTFSGHASAVNCCAVSSRGSFAVSGSDDKTLRVWDVETGAERIKLTGHSAPVRGCAISPDDSFIASVSDDHTVRLWDTVSGAQRLTFAAHTSPVSGCAISPDGSFIVSASGDHTLAVWNSFNGAKRKTLVGHTAWVHRCAISADGSKVVSASYDGTARVWDVNSGHQCLVLYGHRASVMGCSITLDCSLVISTANDKTVKLWDIQSGNCVATLHTDGPLSSCALHPDGERIVAVGKRGVYFLRIVR